MVGLYGIFESSDCSIAIRTMLARITLLSFEMLQRKEIGAMGSLHRDLYVFENRICFVKIGKQNLRKAESAKAKPVPRILRL
jgi:hypothetical protein